MKKVLNTFLSSSDCCAVGQAFSINKSITYVSNKVSEHKTYKTKAMYWLLDEKVVIRVSNSPHLILCLGEQLNTC